VARRQAGRVRRGPGQAAAPSRSAPASAGPTRHPPTAVARAWFVHLFTAAGAVLGLLALLAIMQAEWRAALLWMTAALVIDAADGTLARWARVKEVLPAFDGGLLDNIVDYLNYAFVPAAFLLLAGLLPPGWWGVAGAAGIVLASGYQFCRADAKTEDNYFTGFPSYWNAIVLYLLLLQADPWIGLGIVALLCVLVFVPFRYVYPSRTRPFRPLTIGMTLAWGALCLVALLTYPDHPVGVVWLSLLYIPYYVGISVLARRREARA
jgi:phosphatidylcholine synthase